MFMKIFVTLIFLQSDLPKSVSETQAKNSPKWIWTLRSVQHDNAKRSRPTKPFWAQKMHLFRAHAYMLFFFRGPQMGGQIRRG